MSSSAVEWIEENPGKAVLGAGVMAAVALAARSRLSAVFSAIGEIPLSEARSVGMGVEVTAFRNGLRFEAPDGLTVDISRSRLWCRPAITARTPDSDTRLRLTGSDAIIQTDGATIRAKDNGSMRTDLEDGRRFHSQFYYKPDMYPPVRSGDLQIEPKTVSGVGFSLGPTFIPRPREACDTLWSGNFGGHNIDSKFGPTISLADGVHVNWSGLISGPLRGSATGVPDYKVIPYDKLREQLMQQV